MKCRINLNEKDIRDILSKYFHTEQNQVHLIIRTSTKTEEPVEYKFEGEVFFEKPVYEIPLFEF